MLKERVYKFFRRFRQTTFNRKWRALLSSRNVTLELPILLYVAYHGEANKKDLVRTLEMYGVKNSVARSRLVQLKNDGKLIEDENGNLSINGDKPNFKIKLKSNILEGVMFVLGGFAFASFLIGLKEVFIEGGVDILIISAISMAIFLVYTVYEYAFSMEY